MLDTPIIDVAIGLVFVFLVLSLCATAIVDVMSEWRDWRGRLLYVILRRMLGSDLVLEFYRDERVASLATGRHPRHGPRGRPQVAKEKLFAGWSWITASRIGWFTSFSQWEAREFARRLGGTRLPSYVPESVFADVMLDWLQGIDLPAGLRQRAETRAEIPVALAALLEKMNRRVDGDQVLLRRELVAWFKQANDRASGDFRRKVRNRLLVVGAILAISLNASALRITQHIYESPELRAQLVSSAEAVVEACGESGKDCEVLDEHVQRIRENPADGLGAGLLGWESRDWQGLTSSPGGFLYGLMGWLITMFAISLGADFWYGALKKVVAIKNPKRERAEDEPAATAPSATPDSPAPRSSVSQEPLDITAIEVQGLKGFQPLRFAENHIHAFWLAHFASLAYASKHDLASSTVLACHRLEAVSYDSEGTQAFMFKREDLCIVAFRGTETSLEDWLADLDLRQAPPWGKRPEEVEIRIHGGFSGALDAIWPKLYADLQGIDRPVWLTGHSLGGALATLTACRLRMEGWTKSHTLAGVYTFGQPRVGNAALRDWCAIDVAPRMFRYANASDIVPLVPPPKPFDYDHFGNYRYFDATGRLHHERTMWERIAEHLVPAIRKISSDGGDWKEVATSHLRQRVADHGMARYIECLERIDVIRDLWRGGGKSGAALKSKPPPPP